MSHLRFALIGAGGIAQSYVQAFEGHPTAKMVAVVDVREDAARATAEMTKSSGFTSWDALQSSSIEYDAAIICTPPNTHSDLVFKLAEAKKHILCEKPFTFDSATARSMVAAAHKSNVICTMASKFRYVDDVIKAKSLVTSGILGDIILFENAFTSRVDMTSRWNSKPDVAGGGVLIDNGTHSIDIMRYILGPLASVHAIEGKRAQDIQVEDTVRLFVKTESNIMGSVDLSWSINKELDSYINIYGTLGTIQVGWKESKYRQQSSRDWIVFGKGYNKVAAFSGILKNFAEGVRNPELLLIKPEDAIASVEVIEASYRSLRACDWTPVHHDSISVASETGSVSDISAHYASKS
jgi:predicted dehydrogenase